jgi:hypothetical protein
LTTVLVAAFDSEIRSTALGSATGPVVAPDRTPGACSTFPVTLTTIGD